MPQNNADLVEAAGHQTVGIPSKEDIITNRFKTDEQDHHSKAVACQPWKMDKERKRQENR